MLLGHRYSGVEESIDCLARALAQSGTHDYTLYGQACPAVRSLASDRMRVRLSHWPVQFRAIRILWEQLVFPALLGRDHMDVLHAPGYVAPLLAPVPVVVTLYDLIALLHPELCTRSNHWHYRMLIPLSVRKAARVIVPSTATREALARWVPSVAGRIRVVPLGIAEPFNVVRDPRAAETLRIKYGVRGPFVLFVGRTEPKKNLVRLVEAYALLRRNGVTSYQLVVAGIPSWDQGAVEQAIRRHGLEGTVVFTGRVPREELPLLYSLAALFVFPSLYEGFGLPPLEAMACGAPVVASDRGALPETTGGAAVLVNPLAPPEIARAMQTVLGDSDLRNDLIARGLRHAQDYSWARTAAATEAVYMEAARGDRPGAFGRRAAG
jgi:glycosyltransferase involved in cell wall biosynthesis